MLDPLAIPGVDNVHSAVTCLNNGGIRVLSGSVLEGEDCFPVGAIVGDQDVEGCAAIWRVVIDEDKSAIFERRRFGA